MDIWKELRDEGVDSGLLDEVRRFREAHPLTPARTTMVGNKGQRNREVEQIPETRPQFGS